MTTPRFRPQCSSCKHWHQTPQGIALRKARGEGVGTCENPQVTQRVAPPNPEYEPFLEIGHLNTDSDFGCRFHEKRG